MPNYRIMFYTTLIVLGILFSLNEFLNYPKFEVGKCYRCTVDLDDPFNKENWDLCILDKKLGYVKYITNKNIVNSMKDRGIRFNWIEIPCWNECREPN